MEGLKQINLDQTTDDKNNEEDEEKRIRLLNESEKTNFDRYMNETILTERTKPIMTRILVKDLIKARGKLEPLIGSYLVKSKDVELKLWSKSNTKQLIQIFNVGMGKMFDRDKIQNVDRTNERIRALAHMQAHETVHYVVTEQIYYHLMNFGFNSNSTNSQTCDKDSNLPEQTRFDNCVNKFKTDVVKSYEKYFNALNNGSLLSSSGLDAVCHAKELISTFNLFIPFDFDSEIHNSDLYDIISQFADQVTNDYATTQWCDYLQALPMTVANKQSLQVILKDPISSTRVQNVCLSILSKW